MDGFQAFHAVAFFGEPFRFRGGPVPFIGQRNPEHRVSPGHQVVERESAGYGGLLLRYVSLAETEAYSGKTPQYSAKPTYRPEHSSDFYRWLAANNPWI